MAIRFRNFINLNGFLFFSSVRCFVLVSYSILICIGRRGEDSVRCFLFFTLAHCLIETNIWSVQSVKNKRPSESANDDDAVSTEFASRPSIWITHSRCSRSINWTKWFSIVVCLCFVFVMWHREITHTRTAQRRWCNGAGTVANMTRRNLGHHHSDRILYHFWHNWNPLASTRHQIQSLGACQTV